MTTVEVTRIQGHQPRSTYERFRLTTDVKIDGFTSWCYGQDHPFEALRAMLEMEVEWRAERQENIAKGLADFFRLAGVYAAGGKE